MKLRIRDLREDRDLTQTELAKVLGCTQQTYSRYETGEITIDIYNLIKGCTFSSIIFKLYIKYKGGFFKK